MKKMIIKNGTLLDGKSEKPFQSTMILIEEGKIRQIFENERIEEAVEERSQIIDLEGKFILPGLIDAHVHLCSFEHNNSQELSEIGSTETALSLAAAANCKLALLSGVTTVRDLGAPAYINIKLRELIDAGYLMGPSIVACGYALAMTGGHGTPGISYEIDGTEEARKAVRLMRKNGADCIKLMANGLSVNSPELTADEMRAAVETAHDAGLKVAVHASVWRAVENAISAGVDTIEHGYTLNQEFIEKIVEKGIILVPTLGTVTQVARIGHQFPHWKDHMDAIHKRLETALHSFQLARQLGVRFALGTDGSSWPLLRVGEVLTEAQALQQIGLSNFELLQAATANAAKALDRFESIGTIEPGKYADLLVLNSNPFEDIQALKDIDMVIKRGQIVVRDGRLLDDMKG